MAEFIFSTKRCPAFDELPQLRNVGGLLGMISRWRKLQTVRSGPWWVRVNRSRVLVVLGWISPLVSSLLKAALTTGIAECALTMQAWREHDAGRE